MRWVWVAASIVSAAASSATAAPRDFTPEVRALFAVAACGDAPPPGFDPAIVRAHCAALAKPIAAWRKHWRDRAAPFFRELLGGKYPTTIIYPFGGGDLSTLLVVYPDATDYTTLSLEGMGDPRPITGYTGPRAATRLAADLAKVRSVVGPNLAWAWNTTNQLSAESSDTGRALPGILTIALVALAANGYEPLSARYFRIEPAGALAYLDAADLERADAAPRPAPRKRSHAVQQGAFNHIEIRFRKQGDPTAPTKTFRHITGDLSDAGLATERGPLDYLAHRRDIAAMTKAASYLLWRANFSALRDYLLAHAKHMVSDDTGIPPRFAKPAGFTIELWGTYTGPFFAWARGPVANEMIQLFRGNRRPQPFRFGYYDAANRAHLMYIHK